MSALRRNGASSPIWSPALAIGALVIACGGDEPPSRPGDEAPGVPVAAEDTARVERKAIRTGPRIAGTLEARRRADVRAEAGGRVLEARAEIGQRVRKGDVLARIESTAQADALRSTRAGVRSAEERMNLARRQVERTRSLVEAGALAERDLENAHNDLVAAEAAVQQAAAQEASARAELGNATARAPMDGVVSQAPVHAGDVVAPGGPLYTIIDPASMRLEASVASEHLAAVAPGTPVAFTVHGYPGQTFQGTIERVAPAADPTTRQVAILVAVPNQGGKLVAGLFADGRAAGVSRDALVVPGTAIDSGGEVPTATRLNRGVVERVNVQIGIEDAASELVEVVSGLSRGDTVLLRSARQLPPGTRVVAGQPAAPAAPEQPPASAAKPTER